MLMPSFKCSEILNDPLHLQSRSVISVPNEFPKNTFQIGLSVFSHGQTEKSTFFFYYSIVMLLKKIIGQTGSLVNQPEFLKPLSREHKQTVLET